MALAYQLLVGPGPSPSLLQPWTDLSGYVKSVSTQRGRSTELDDIQAGTAKIILDDASGVLTPGNASSAYVAQTVPDVPFRLSAIQGGNLLPYQLANVDHYADQTTGDAESFGKWATVGAVSGGTQKGALTGYQTVQGGLVWQHVAGAVNGDRAFIVNAANSRIANLPAGTYTMAFRVKGVTFGSGATIGASVTQLNYLNAHRAPITGATTNMTPVALTGAYQTVHFTFTVPANTSGLNTIQIEAWTDMVGGVQATVSAFGFQIYAGTATPAAFVSGDGCYPLFAGWADSWYTTTQGAAGAAIVELDGTDQLYALGNASVGNPYISMIQNTASTMYYFPLNETSAQITAGGNAIVDYGPTQTSISVYTANSTDTNSYGLTAGATDLLAVTTATVGVTGVGTGVNPNFAGAKPTYSGTGQSGTSYKWSQGSTGNCGGTIHQAQFPQTARLNGVMPAAGSSGAGSFDCWIELDTTGSNRTVTLIGPKPSDGGQVGWVMRFIYAPGTSTTNMTLETGCNATRDLTVPSLFDGAAHHVALTWNLSGAFVDWTVFFDGVQVASAADSYSVQVTQTVIIGAEQVGSTLSNCWIGRIAHVAISSNGNLDVTARVMMGQAQYTLSEAGRIAVLMQAAGADCFTDCIESGAETTGWISWSSGTGISDALKVAASECGGVFLIGRTGNPLYQVRTRFPARITFQDSAGTSPDDGIQFFEARDHVINNVVVTLPNGTLVRAQSFTSIGQRSLYTLTMSVSYSDSSGAQTVANNIVTLHAIPRVRVTGVQFTCVNPGLSAQGLGLDVGARISLAGLPSSAPSASMNFIVQQVSVSGDFNEGGVTVPVVAVELSPDLS